MATVSVHIDELAPLSQSPVLPGSGHGTGPLRDDQFDAAMLRLRRILLGQGRSRSQVLESRNDEALAEEDLGKGGEATPEQRRKVLGLDDFEQAITSMVDDAKDRQEIVDRLLVLLLEVSMWMRLTRLGDIDGAHDFLSAWYFKACRLGHLDEERITALQQHIVTGAATLYSLTSDPEARRSVGTALHDALEKFYRGPVDQDHALARLFPDLQAGFSALLLKEDAAPHLAAALKEILAIPTRRQRLDEALVLADAGKSVPPDWEVFSTDIGRELWEKLQDPEWNKRVRRGAAGKTACSFCYMTFPYYEIGQLRRQRFTRCIHCKRFTVDTNP